MRIVLLFIALCIVVFNVSDVSAVEIYKKQDTQVILDLENVLGVEWHNNHKLEANNPRLKSDDYLKISESLLARLRWGKFSIGLEMEGLYYPDKLMEIKILSAPNTPNPSYQETAVSDNSFNLNRYYLTYNSKLLKIDVGDYYVTLGRGLALSMRKEGENEVNNTLRGGKVELRYKDTRATALAGFANVLNIDPNHERTQSDPFDLISAFRVEQRLAKYFSLGTHFVNAKFGALESGSKQQFIADKETYIAGGSLEIPDIADYLSFYFEGNYIYRNGRKVNSSIDGYDDVNDDGFGLYGNVSLYVDRFTLTAEYKNYNDFLFRRARAKIDYLTEEDTQALDSLEFFEDIYYNNVPNLELKDIETNRDYGNDHGGRVKAEYNFEESGTVPYLVGYFTFNQHSGGSNALGGLGGDSDAKWDRIWHVYGGLTQYIGSYEIYANGGYRNEYSRENERKILDLIHVKAGATIPLVQDHTLTLEAFFQRKNSELLGEKEYDLDLTLGYAFSRYISLSFLYTLQKKDFDAGLADDFTEHFIAGEIRSTPVSWMDISIFGGQVRESQRCYGGFCRQVPAFEGVKGKVKIRF